MRQGSLAESRNPVGRAIGEAAAVLLDRSAAGASLRLVLLSGVLAGYWFALAWTAGFPVVLPQSWTVDLPFPLNPMLDLAASFFAPAVLVHLLPALAGIWLALRLAGHYLADLFELENFGTASRYLASATFGLGQGWLEIDRSDLETYDPSHPLARIGGPGRLRIHLGFACVVETAVGGIEIYGPQPVVALSGFDRLRGVIDLRDQVRELGEVRGVTRDGVEILARQAQMVFRVYTGGRPRSLTDPYPFTEEAVRRLVYGRPVAEAGPRKWTEALTDLVEREIQAFIASLTLEEFLALQAEPAAGEGNPAPAETAIHIPAQRLAVTIHTDAVRKRLRDEGLELTWASVGSWEIPDAAGAATAATAGAGVAQALVQSWREVERARRWRDPSALAGRRERAGQEYEAQTLREVIEAWHGAQRAQPDVRAAAALRALRARLPSVGATPVEAESAAALAYLDRLIEHATGGQST